MIFGDFIVEAFREPSKLGLTKGVCIWASSQTGGPSEGEWGGGFQ